MPRKKLFFCAPVIWVILLVTFWATSATAVNQTSTSAAITANSACGLAGGTRYTFAEVDYDIITAYLAGNNYVLFTVTLGATNYSGSPDAPILCQPITNAVFSGTGLGALGGDLPDDLVELDTLDSEVSDMTDGAGGGADSTADVTAYVSGAASSQIIYIYITDIQAATNWADSNTHPWIRIGLDEGISTEIWADVHDYSGLNRLNLTTQFTPVTLTIAGDNEIGHYIAPSVNSIDVTATSMPVYNGTCCADTGAVDLKFESNTVLSHGDRITMDLASEMSLCSDISLVIGNGGDNIAFDHDDIIAVGGGGPVGYFNDGDSMPAGFVDGLNSTLGGVYFVISGTAGSQRITIDIVGASAQVLASP